MMHHRVIVSFISWRSYYPMMVNLLKEQGYNLEDATGLSLNGDLDIESIFAGHLPKSHPSFDPHRYLEMSERWKASPLPTEPVRALHRHPFSSQPFC
jgi:hypothetical protein